jgi:hypothetical protein
MTTTQTTEETTMTSRTGRTIGRIWLGNGGQIVLQTETYQHSYDSAECAATDIGDLLESNGSTDGWEGDESAEGRIDLRDPAMATNGNDYLVIADDDTVEALAVEAYKTGGAAAKELARMLAPHQGPSGEE